MIHKSPGEWGRRQWLGIACVVLGVAATVGAVLSWRHRRAAAPPGPRIAIVLDDWGYSTRNVPALQQLRQAVTLSVLPRLRYSETVARTGRAAGCEIILHLPMESHRHDLDPRFRMEQRTILTSMPDAEIAADVREALASVPGCRGVSNHQGSKATEDARVMHAVLRELKTRRLYFLDSLVTPRSVGVAVARQVGVSCAERQRFLDNENREAYIEAQLRRLAADARAHGSSVGIGHDRPITLAVLARVLPQLEREGIHCVRLSELVK